MRLRVPEDTIDFGRIPFDASGHVEPIATQTDIFKRGFDIVVASIALVLLAPLILLFALLVRFQDGGRSFFAQSRYGLNGKTFRCYKLRSMSENADECLADILTKDADLRSEWQSTQKLKKDPRITPLGGLLRKSSIDELPQLWNVIKGDMSIVGPRPIVKNEIQKYGDSYRFYTAVRPGLTGLWQVEGRTDTTYQERVEMDVRYVQTRSFWKDVWIVVRTIPAVIASRGAV